MLLEHLPVLYCEDTEEKTAIPDLKQWLTERAEHISYIVVDPTQSYNGGEGWLMIHLWDIPGHEDGAMINAALPERETLADLLAAPAFVGIRFIVQNGRTPRHYRINAEGIPVY